MNIYLQQLVHASTQKARCSYLALQKSRSKKSVIIQGKKQHDKNNDRMYGRGFFKIKPLAAKNLRMLMSFLSSDVGLENEM